MNVNVLNAWAVNSAGECHVDIVEVASSILASPTKAYSILKREWISLFLFFRHLKKMSTTTLESHQPELH